MPKSPKTRELIKKMSKWKLTDDMIKQFVDHLFKPHELRTLIIHATKRLKEMEDSDSAA